MHDFPSFICVTADVGCAYLNARMPKYDPDKLVFIKNDPDIVTLLSSAMIDPSLRTNGSMLLSTSTNNVAISGSILINTSFSGSCFGILAFK